MASSAQGALGTGTSDSILARLSRGESVVTAAGTKGNEATLGLMNRGAKFEGYASSGVDIGAMASAMIPAWNAPAMMIDAGGAMRSAGMGGGNPVNIHVERHPGVGVQVQHLTPNDVSIIARQEVATGAPKAVAASQRDPNGMMAKASRDTLKTVRWRR